MVWGRCSPTFWVEANVHLLWTLTQISSSLVASCFCSCLFGNLYFSRERKIELTRLLSAFHSICLWLWAVKLPFSFQIGDSWGWFNVALPATRFIPAASWTHSWFRPAFALHYFFFVMPSFVVEEDLKWCLLRECETVTLFVSFSPRRRPPSGAAARSTTTALCPPPPSSSPFTTRPGPPCWGPSTACWRPRPPCCWRRSSSLTTTATEVRPTPPIRAVWITSWQDYSCWWLISPQKVI